MDENMTGLSPEEVKRQINEFYHSVLALEGEFRMATSDLINDLSRTWCSPRAVDFEKKHINRLRAIPFKITRIATAFCRNAFTAYNRLAEANGTQYIRPEFGTDEAWYDQMDPQQSIKLDDIIAEIDAIEAADPTPFRLKEQSPNGIVGMNIAQVRIIRGEFASKANACINKFDELPYDIAFYDPQGAMKEAYRSSITELTGEIREEVDAILADLNVAFETEENRIELAKEQATQTMNG